MIVILIWFSIWSQVAIIYKFDADSCYATNNSYLQLDSAQRVKFDYGEFLRVSKQFFSYNSWMSISDKYAGEDVVILQLLLISDWQQYLFIGKLK